MLSSFAPVVLALYNSLRSFQWLRFYIAPLRFAFLSRYARFATLVSLRSACSVHCHCSPTVRQWSMIFLFFIPKDSILYFQKTYVGMYFIPEILDITFQRDYILDIPLGDYIIHSQIDIFYFLGQLYIIYYLPRNIINFYTGMFIYSLDAYSFRYLFFRDSYMILLRFLFPRDLYIMYLFFRFRR